MHACSQCTIGGSGDTPEQVMRDIDLYETLLPKGGVSRLFTTMRCELCKDEPKGERNGYAMVFMAHPEPKRIQRRLFRDRVSPVGTMIPVQLSVCADCRKKLLAIEYIPVLIPVVFGIIMVILSMTQSTRTAMLRVATWFPALLWVLAIAGGILLGKAVGKGLKKKFGAHTYVDVMEHPVLKEMAEKGWSPIAGGQSKVVFSKSRRVIGLGTAIESEIPVDK